MSPWAEAYFRTVWHLDPSNRLATKDTGGKLGALPPFWEGELGPHLKQSRLGGGLPPSSIPSGILIYPAIWPRQIWAENWELCSFWGAGFPSNTM